MVGAFERGRAGEGDLGQGHLEGCFIGAGDLELDFGKCGGVRRLIPCPLDDGVTHGPDPAIPGGVVGVPVGDESHTAQKTPRLELFNGKRRAAAGAAGCAAPVVTTGRPSVGPTTQNASSQRVEPRSESHHEPLLAPLYDNRSFCLVTRQRLPNRCRCRPPLACKTGLTPTKNHVVVGIGWIGFACLFGRPSAVAAISPTIEVPKSIFPRIGLKRNGFGRNKPIFIWQFRTDKPAIGG